MSKKHCYTVNIRRDEHMPGLRYHVLAESKAQARAFIANTMIVVVRTDPNDLLDLRRDQVIDATEVPAPVTGSEEDQAPLPLAEPDEIDKAVAAFKDLGDGATTDNTTAAEALEVPK